MVSNDATPPTAVGSDANSATDHAMYRVSEGVAWIVLNRPDRLNAMTVQMDRALRDFVRRADQDRACVAICITGAGNGFCSGADLSARPETPPGTSLGEFVQAALPYERRPQSLSEFRFGYLTAARKPVIAAINGAAVGVGLVLAAFCDIRIASSVAKLGFTYSRVGLVAEYGLAWWLPRMIGMGASRDLLLSGRVIDAVEASRMGLVEQVVEASAFDEHVRGYMRLLVERCAPRALATIKAQLNAAGDETLLDTIASSDTVLEAAKAGSDFEEGRAAFREKRLPRFTRLDSEETKHE